MNPGDAFLVAISMLLFKLRRAATQRSLTARDGGCHPAEQMLPMPVLCRTLPDALVGGPSARPTAPSLRNALPSRAGCKGETCARSATTHPWYAAVDVVRCRFADLAAGVSSRYATSARTVCADAAHT